MNRDTSETHLTISQHIHLNKQTFGDSISPKQTTITRIILQNPNGIQHQDNMINYKLLLHHMTDIEADIILLPETNLNWNTYDVYTQTRQIRRSLFPHSIQVTSTSPIVFQTPYQPGGVASIITNNLVGRHVSHTTDYLGRWTTITLYLTAVKRLTIITCYQVCKANISSIGPRTAFAQQWTILRQKGHRNPQPRETFRADLDSLLTQLRKQNHEIIIAGDFNEPLNEHNTATRTILNRHDLIDCIESKHGQHSIPTYARGTKCIDYIFATSGVVSSIHRTGILALDHIIHSDHRGLYIDVDLTKIGNTITPLESPSARLVHSTHQPNADKYIATLDKLLQDHNVYTRAMNITSTTSPVVVEAIDCDMTRLMIASEKSLRKKSSTPFSSKLAQSSITVSLLIHHLKSLTTGNTRTTQIDRLQAKLHERLVLPITIADTKKAITTAKKQCKSLRTRAEELRIDFLNSISSASDPKIIKRIQRAEELKKSYNKLCHLLKPRATTMLNQLQVLQDDHWVTLTDPQEIEDQIIQRNIQHFQSAKGTPFTTHPLSTELDWRIKSEQYDHILNGNNTISHDPIVQQVLQQCKKKVPSFDPTFSLQDIVNRFRKWKETTTTSPSGRHLGHYKALLPSHTSTMEAYQQSPAGKIMQIHLAILNYCAITGYSMNRWQKIVTTIIPKDPRSIKISRLRVIHLYEADLTAVLSMWNRRMTSGSLKHRTLNAGAFGAVPGRSCADPPFIITLQSEIAHLSRTALIVSPSDAAQCYDRLIPSQVLLSCMSHGIPKSAAQCIGNTLLNAKYHVKTLKHTSTTYWSHSSHNPVYGTGQGSGISPAACCVAYSDLLHIHSKHTTGADYRCPITSNRVTINNISFVDDITTTTNQPNHRPLALAKLIRDHTNNIQQWSDYLYTIGGKVEASKTSVIPLIWSFLPNGTPVPTTAHMPDPIIKCQQSQSTFPLTVNPVQKSFKMLGFHLCLHPDSNDQYDALQSKADRISKIITASSVNFREAYLCYFAVYIPAVLYAISLTSLTKKQCHKLTSAPTCIFLQKCGYAKTTHRDIVFSPRCIGGLGFRHMYYEHGISQIIRFVTTMRTPGQARDLLYIAIHWSHISAGSTHHLFQDNILCPYLEGTWIKSLHTFLVEHNIRLCLPHACNPIAKRSNDPCIMDAFRTLKLGPSRLARLNYCRLYLQVTYLSEICVANGRSLQPNFWDGTNGPCKDALFPYPNQSKPNHDAWDLWKQCIRKCFCKKRTTDIQYASHPDSLPVTAPWYKSIHTELSQNVSDQRILEFLTQDSSMLVAATDGSYKDKVGAFGWTLWNANTEIAFAYGPAHAAFTGSFRAECNGLLSFLWFLHRLCSSTNNVPSMASIDIHIDSQSLIDTIKHHKQRTTYYSHEAVSPDRDIILQIEHYIDQIPIHINLHKVKSHQDKFKISLTSAERANCRADQLATMGINPTQYQLRSPEFPASHCHIQIGDQTITHSIPNKLREHLFRSKLQHTTTRRHKLKHDQIHWQTFHRVAASNSKTMKFHTKWVHMILPTGTVIHRRDCNHTSTCPVCHQPEDNNHLLLCTHVTRQILYKKLLSHIRQSAPFNNSNLTSLLVDCLDSTINHRPLPNLPPSSIYYSTIQAQTTIGWCNLLRGLVSPQWFQVPDHPESSTTLAQVITTSSPIIQSIWKLRNDQRHRHDSITAIREEKQYLRSKISALYTLQYKVLPCDRRLFRSIASLLGQSIPTQRAWVSMNQSIIQQSVKQAEASHTTNTRPITAYFPPKHHK